MKKRDLAIIFNAIIVAFELVGFISSLIFNKRIMLEFYTEDSNVLALVCSSIFLFYLMNNKKIPNWLRMFKYLTTVCLAITVLVVIFVLIPMGDFNFKAYMYEGTLLYHHTICPLMSIVTFLFFDGLKKFNTKECVISLGFTFIYSVITIVLNLVGVLEGPYPFLMIRSQTFLMSLIWLVLLFTLAFFVAHSIRVLHKVINGG